MATQRLILQAKPLFIIPYRAKCRLTGFHLFLSSKFDSDGRRIRDCVLRRGKMPCYVYDLDMAPSDFLYPVRPTTSLIETTFEKKTGNKVGEKPFYINEEEILQTGIKIVKNYQRARGLNGKVFFWYGARKQLNRKDANSGLVFDRLTEK